ncbi:hypothetical protein HJG60_009310 [Phyllostomus discolor]|uniref:Uncharacterized protein n=1 Tax=Phyllostomus discolor TaxID=89673 RepID=A0A834DCE2_9CHIR|nr:hypothetical protein HJG60_009310 [Phyllostomus discolor]
MASHLHAFVQTIPFARNPCLTLGQSWKSPTNSVHHPVFPASHRAPAAAAAAAEQGPAQSEGPRLELWPPLQCSLSKASGRRQTPLELHTTWSFRIHGQHSSVVLWKTLIRKRRKHTYTAQPDLPTPGFQCQPPWGHQVSCLASGLRKGRRLRAPQWNPGCRVTSKRNREPGRAGGLSHAAEGTRTADSRHQGISHGAHCLPP